MSISLYGVKSIPDNKYEAHEIIELSGKEALLLANWFYTFYHKRNIDYVEEASEYIMFFVDEITLLHEHLIQAMEGKTHLVPVYPLPYDNLSYIEPESKEYYRILSHLYDCIHNLFYNQNTYNDDMLFYRISW